MQIVAVLLIVAVALAFIGFVVTYAPVGFAFAGTAFSTLAPLLAFAVVAFVGTCAALAALMGFLYSLLFLKLSFYKLRARFRAYRAAKSSTPSRA